MLKGAHVASGKAWIAAVILGLADLVFTVIALFFDHTLLGTTDESHINLVKIWNETHPIVNYLVNSLGRAFWRPDTSYWWLEVILLLLSFLQGAFIGALIGAGWARLARIK